MALGKNVKALRDQRGWTLKDLEKRSGVPWGTIGALEARDSVRSQYAAQLAAGLGVAIDDLLNLPTNYPLSLPPSAPVGFAQAVSVLAASLSEVDEATRRRVMAVLADLAGDPDDYERIARAAQAVCDTGKRRAA